MGYADILNQAAGNAPSSANTPTPSDFPTMEERPDLRLKILQQERGATTDPAMQASLDREISRVKVASPIVPTIKGGYADLLNQAANDPAVVAPGSPTATPAQMPSKGGRPALEAVVAEPALQMATGMAAAIPAGLAGLYQGAKNFFTGDNSVSAADRVQEVQDSLTYQPRTDAGKAGASVANYLPQKMEQGADWLGEHQKDVTGAIGRTIGSMAGPVGGMLGEAAGNAIPVTPATQAAIKTAALSAPALLTHRPTASAEVLPAGSVGAAAVDPVTQARAMVANASPELRQAVENAAQKVGGGSSLNLEALQRHVEADSLPVPVKLTTGQATQDPMLISGERNTRGQSQAMVDRFNQQDKNLSANIDAIREDAAPDIFTSAKHELGQAPIDAYEAMDAAKQADISAKYQALKDANGGQFPLDVNALMDDVTKNLHDNLLYDHAPPKIMATLNRLQDAGSMTFENFESLRTNLARIQRSMTADGNEKAAAGTIRQSLENMPLPPEAADLKPLADAARAAAKARFDAIDADPAYKAVTTGKATPDSFIDKYILSKSAPLGDVQTLMGNIGGDASAKQAISAATLDRFKESAVKQNGFSPAGYDKVLMGVGPKLGEILEPEHIQTLQALGNTARAAKAQPAGSFVNNSNTLVGAMADYGKAGLEGLVNVKSGGLPLGTWARDIMARRAENKSVMQTLQPGGGLLLKDMAK